MRLTNILLAGAAIATISTGALAQDVVMRRPLPNANGSGPGTPTPTSTDTPSTTTTAQGWKVDCERRDNVCFTVSRSADGSTTTKGEVDDLQCGSTQSAEQQALAHSAGLIGLGEGVTATSGFDSCGSSEVLTAHGWKTDCVARTTTCAQVTKAGAGAATVVAVDASQCGSSQTPAQQALALQNGLVGLGEGVDASYVPAACGPTRPQDPPADKGHGWGIDCRARTISCWEMETVDYPWGDSGVSSSQVDAGECPATQSDGANALALQTGYYGMGQGVDATHGLEMCNQTSDRYLDYALGYCDSYSTGKTVTECVRLTMPDPDDGQGPISQLSLGSDETAMATCLKPSTNPAWEATALMFGGGFRSNAADDTFGILRREDIAGFAGRNCGPAPETTYGKTCTGEGTSQCHAVNYLLASGNVTGTSDAASQLCDDENPDANDMTAIQTAGMMSPNVPDSACHLPLYASQGQCVFKVTYDPGWPQSGQSHVDYDFIEKCFAINGAEDPANATATPADLAKCTSQEPNAAQTAQLQQLEPVFHNPKTIDRTCDVTYTVNNAKYVTQNQDPTGTEKMQEVESRSGVGWYYVADVQYKIKYACTDDEDYFTDRSAFASRFSTTEVTRCYADHLRKLQDLRDIGTDPANYRNCGGNDEGEVCEMPFAPAYSVSDDANAEEITVRYSDVRRVPWAENPYNTGIYPK